MIDGRYARPMIGETYLMEQVTILANGELNVYLSGEVRIDGFGDAKDEYRGSFWYTQLSGKNRGVLGSTGLANTGWYRRFTPTVNGVVIIE